MDEALHDDDLDELLIDLARASDAWDLLRPGDPPPGMVHPAATCAEHHPSALICSRRAGHDGQHVAVGITVVCATWPQIEVCG
jgi:hypothetical protein